MPKQQIKNILIQVLFWSTSVFCILLILGTKNELDNGFWNRVLITLIGTSLVVYVNLRWLLPKLYYRKKIALYVLSCIGLLSVIVWGTHYDGFPWNKKERIEQAPHNEQKPYRQNDANDAVEGTNFRWLVRNLPPLFICLLGSSLLSVIRFANQKEKEAMALEKIQLETEIKFLKSQINPHFLFNSLHNIYSLSVMKSELASSQLLQLSDILRYMLHDSNEEKVPLTREVEYLRNYLGLAQLKDSRGMDVSFTVPAENSNLVVAPLLFIPFVENAFKHSQIEDLENGYIRISLNIKGQELEFNVENSKPKNVYRKDEVGGIGLSNIKQRLKLLYPNKHTLDIDDSQDAFKVNLVLDCL